MPLHSAVEAVLLFADAAREALLVVLLEEEHVAAVSCGAPGSELNWMYIESWLVYA